VDFIATKRGLAAFKRLLDSASIAKVVRSNVAPEDLLVAVATLCRGPGGKRSTYTRRMGELLLDGLRHGAGVLKSKRHALNTEYLLACDVGVCELINDNSCIT
jgi:hypothetical protein